MRPKTDTTSRRAENPAVRRMCGHPRRAILIGLLPAAAIAAACGSSSSTSSTSTTKATTSTSAAAPAVQTANNPKYGTILVDGQGRTLYSLSNPTSGAPVPCTGSCLAIWPAATLPAGQTTVSTGPGVNSVTTVSSSGGLQLAYKGMPLYRYTGDVTTGAANGEGIGSFGGVWHVIRVSGGGTAAPATPGGTTATTSGGAGTTSTTSRGGGSSGY